MVVMKNLSQMVCIDKIDALRLKFGRGVVNERLNFTSSYFRLISISRPLNRLFNNATSSSDTMACITVVCRLKLAKILIFDALSTASFMSLPSNGPQMHIQKKEYYKIEIFVHHYCVKFFITTLFRCK